ncbi:MAG: CotH kinase family protein [Sphingobacteriales bacterium]|jgi:hypothetical protein|nr:CotH kinase family protein [Sphingobacteriales bacterium]
MLMFKQQQILYVLATLFVLNIFTTTNVLAQKWPKELIYNSSQHTLSYGGASPTEGLYAIDSIRSLYLQFDQANYWTTLTNNYKNKIDLTATLTVNGQVYDSVGVRFKGQTSYSQIKNKQKKSFNLSIDYADDKQDLMGYTTLNLNNCYEDPSMMREAFYLNQIRNYIPAAKANYVQLYINGESWGIYPNVQQLNKKFLKEWFLTNNGTNWRADVPDGMGGGFPAWGDGTAAFNYLGNDTTEYQKYYTLKSTEETDPWDFLVTACHVLDTVKNNNAETVLANYFDLDRTLWFLACEIVFADDDSYVYKGKMDYYLYHDVETGRMTPLEFDGNSAYFEEAVDKWGPFYNVNNKNYPLLNRLLNVKSLRQRYLAHMRTILETSFDPDKAAADMDAFAQRIDQYVKDDTKKLYSYTQFTSEVKSLKQFVEDRRDYLMGNTELKQQGPAIADVAAYTNNYLWQQPTNTQTVTVLATVTATDDDIDGVWLYYSNNVVGNFTKTAMFDDGMHNDLQANDGIFGATIPEQEAGTWVRFYVAAIAANTYNTVSYNPPGAEHNVYAYSVQLSTDAPQLTIIDESQPIAAYPNPAGQVLYITTPQANNSTNTQTASTNQQSNIQIVNVLGQILYSNPYLPMQTLTVNTQDWPSGVYAIKVGNWSQKILVAH